MRQVLPFLLCCFDNYWPTNIRRMPRNTEHQEALYAQPIGGQLVSMRQN